jgi:hypothetical protein
VTSPHLHAALAQARLDELRRTAGTPNPARRTAQPGPARAAARGVTLRFGSHADEKALALLAALDSARSPVQPVLLAEVDGELLAALALTDRTVIANPFHHTADLTDLLRTRANQLNRDRRPRRIPCLPSWSRLRAQAGW